MKSLSKQALEHGFEFDLMSRFWFSFEKMKSDPNNERFAWNLQHWKPLSMPYNFLEGFESKLSQLDTLKLRSSKVCMLVTKKNRTQACTRELQNHSNNTRTTWRNHMVLRIECNKKFGQSSNPKSACRNVIQFKWHYAMIQDS